MAPLPPNNTGRVYFDYVTGEEPASQQHTIQMRFAVPLGFDLDDAQESMLTLLTTIGAANLSAGWRVLGVRLSQPGSNFSLPFPLTPALAAFEGTGTTPEPWVETREMTVQGRSTTSGRRVDLSIYGTSFDTPDNLRIVAGPSGPGLVVAAVSAFLTGESAAGFWVAIDATSASWYPYFNFNFNSYWERRIRSV